jgi:hypothetical protein
MYGEIYPCRICGIELAYTEENFVHNHRGTNGLQRTCKTCERERSKRKDEKLKTNAEQYHKRKEQQKIWQKNNKQTIRGAYNSYKSSAKHDNRYFDLTIEDFEQYWQVNCYYCGTQLKTVGFDRINSDLGYVKDNILPCCTQCNTMKMNYSQEDFLYQCLLIVKRHFAKEGETI